MAQNKEQTTSTKKPFALNLLDNLIGEDGIKTDLKIGLTNSTYFNLGTTIVLSLGVIIILFMITSAIFKINHGTST